MSMCVTGLRVLHLLSRHSTPVVCLMRGWCLLLLVTLLLLLLLLLPLLRMLIRSTPLFVAARINHRINLLLRKTFLLKLMEQRV